MNQFEIKTSKVKTAKYDGTWQDLHKYTITFENGDQGTYFSKSDNQEKFKAGTETTYKYDELKNRVKPHWEGNQQNSDHTYTSKNDNREIYIIRQSSLKCATEYVIANGGNITTILHNADILTKWVQTGEVPATQQENNDLPF